MKNQGRGATFMVSFTVTLLLIVGSYCMLTSLYRMENTMSPTGYEVLQLEKKPDSILSITALNEKYFLDFAIIKENVGFFSTFEPFVPSSIRSLYYALDSLTNAVVAGFHALFP